jgi:hypothetical protein
MWRRPVILVVVPSPAVADAVVPAFGGGMYDVVVVRTFARAKTHLALRPALLIAEIRLGEYNGLHLALRGQAAGVPTVVIGEPDSVLEAEARNLGATYLRTTEPLRHNLLQALPELLREDASHVDGPARDVTWLDRADWQQPSRANAGVPTSGKSSQLFH